MKQTVNGVLYRVEKEVGYGELGRRATLRDLRRLVSGLNKLVRADLIKNVAKLKRPELMKIITDKYLVGEGLSSTRPNTLNLYEDEPDDDGVDGAYPLILSIDDTDFMKSIRKGRAPKAKPKAKPKPKPKGKAKPAKPKAKPKAKKKA